MPYEYKPKVKFFVTTKADLATKKVNEWLDEHCDDIDVIRITPFLSYTELKGSGGYMIGCMVEYMKREPIEVHVHDLPTPVMNWTGESDGISI